MRIDNIKPESQWIPGVDCWDASDGLPFSTTLPLCPSDSDLPAPDRSGLGGRVERPQRNDAREGVSVSYDIAFERTGKKVFLDRPHDLRGGTYALGGTQEAWLNITYNYSGFFAEVLGAGGIRSLHGKSGRELLPILEDAVAKLGTERDVDYWKATRGNAGAALNDLLSLAYAVPSDAVLQGD